LSTEKFGIVPRVTNRVRTIVAGDSHTGILGSRGDMHLFGDGKHGQLCSSIYSNEFEPYCPNELEEYRISEVVCGGCQTIILANKKKSEQKHKVQKNNEQISSEQKNPGQIEPSICKEHNKSMFSVFI
jgi:hypothetical protein